jgi:hypothetical protein
MKTTGIRIGLRLFIALASVGFPAAAEAAEIEDRKVEDNLNTWFNYFGDHPIAGSKWGAHLEAQIRRSDGVNKWQQLLLRPGVNYEVNKLLMLNAGYGFVRSYPHGDFPAARAGNEHRFFEQAWLRYRTGKLGWTTRLRFENRFVPTTNSVTGKHGYRYENRFRAWQQIRVSISNRTYLTAYDEIFLFVKPYVSNSVFDQNRAYGAYGVSLDKSWRLELGYMNQAILQRSGAVRESNHTVMVSLFSTAPFGKKKSR